MSAALAARAAILATLQGDAALGGLINQIADGEPVKASPPWLMVGAGQATGWGARGLEGVTLRQAIELVVRGDQLEAVADILERVDELLRSMDDNLGDWRVTYLAPDRARVRRVATEWRASVDYSLRLVRLI